jgi:hypothetical protein
MDVNRQAWNAATTLLVHPAELYVGLRSERTFVRANSRSRSTHRHRPGRQAVPGQKIAMRAARLEWQFKAGSWQEVEAAVQPCTVHLGQEPVRCTFETPEGRHLSHHGHHHRRARAAQPERDHRWVSGGQRPPARQVEQEEVDPDPRSQGVRSRRHGRDPGAGALLPRPRGC